ncbi:hypothetical protein [Serratia proteamaculans]|uniref:hypothetical protein n=1 Tax=Serratia proteamaculans TaxID=28151 RepID=UPI00111C582D|nr:hypothetical protein [Serratia proteamaculans]
MIATPVTIPTSVGKAVAVGKKTPLFFAGKYIFRRKCRRWYFGLFPHFLFQAVFFEANYYRQNISLIIIIGFELVIIQLAKISGQPRYTVQENKPTE